MTPLRQRLLDDMRMRNLSVHTQDAYVRAVTQFARHFNRSPDQLGREHVREYLLHLIKLGRAWDTYNQARCALHFFYRVTLSKDWPLERLPCAKVPKRLPVVLSRDEVGQFFAAARRLPPGAAVRHARTTNPTLCVIYHEQGHHRHHDGRQADRPAGKMTGRLASQPVVRNDSFITRVYPCPLRLPVASFDAPCPSSLNSSSAVRPGSRIR